MEIKAFGVTFDTEKITSTHKLIGSAIISIVILGAGIYYYVIPPYEELKKLNAEVESLIQKESELKLKVKNIDIVKKEYEQLLVKIAEIEKKIPKQDNLPSLIIDVEKISSLNSIDLVKFVPGGLQPFDLPPHLKGSTQGGTGVEQNIKQLPVAINVRGNYPTLIDMFNTFENYERTLSITGLSLTPGNNKTFSPYKPLEVSFNLKAFVLGGGTQ